MATRDEGTRLLILGGTGMLGPAVGVGANTLCVPVARRDVLRAFRTRPCRADDFRPA